METQAGAPRGKITLYIFCWIFLCPLWAHGHETPQKRPEHESRRLILGITETRIVPLLRALQNIDHPSTPYRGAPLRSLQELERDLKTSLQTVRFIIRTTAGAAPSEQGEQGFLLGATFGAGIGIGLTLVKIGHLVEPATWLNQMPLWEAGYLTLSSIISIGVVVGILAESVAEADQWLIPWRLGRFFGTTLRSHGISSREMKTLQKILKSLECEDLLTSQRIANKPLAVEAPTGIRIETSSVNETQTQSQPSFHSLEVNADGSLGKKVTDYY